MRTKVAHSRGGGSQNRGTVEQDGTFEPPANATLNDLSAITASLRDLFGRQLAATVAGVEDPLLIDEWADHRQRPGKVAAERLRNAWRVADYLLQAEDRETVRTWFLGLNPELGDRVPVLEVAQEPAAVMAAARVFVAYG
jgi:hypothetical protein